MQVYAFVGKTGTGKSYNALKVAKSHDIKYIIDDAILIKETKVIAGKSAKTEASKIASFFRPIGTPFFGRKFFVHCNTILHIIKGEVIF